MYGKNAVAKERKYRDGYLVHSTWNTIQGEGPFAGWPAVFVRFSDCNLRCFFCDTDFTGGSHHTATSLAEEIERLSKQMHNCKLIVFTGGEPMLQALPELMTEIRKRHIVDQPPFHFQIETAGTVWPEGLEGFLVGGNCTLVCSPKTPTLHAKMDKYCNHWKYIMRDGEMSLLDGLPLKSTQVEGKDMRVYRAQRGVIYAQPCDEGDDAEATRANLDAAVKASMAFGYRLSLQLHKIVGLA